MAVAVAVAADNGAGVEIGAGEAGVLGGGEADGLTNAGVGAGVGEGLAPALQPAASKSASDAKPTASRVTIVCKRIASRLRDA